MDTANDRKSCILRLQEAFGANSNDNPDLKWKLLKELSTFYLNEPNELSIGISTEYSAILTALIDALKPTLFKNKQEEQLFSKFFLNGINHDSFMLLVHRLSLSSPSYQQMKILDLLENFLYNGNVYCMLLSRCRCDLNLDSLQKFMYNADSSISEDLITMLVSLPERVANKANQRAKKIFSISSYVPFLVSSIWKVLCSLHKNLTSQKGYNIQFLGKVTTRLCSAGHSSIVVRYLCAQFMKACATDITWRHIAQDFICKMPLTAIEMFLSHALLQIPWYGYVEWLLGDGVVTNHQMQYLMTVKFFFIRQFKDDLILRNIIGYLAGSDKRLHLFYKVLRTLLDSWSDESAFRHQSFDQKYYLASAIVICTAHLKTVKKETDVKDLMQKALLGVQVRLGSPELLVRSTAMFVGSSLVSVLDPDAPKLEFDHDFEQPEVKHLQDLLCVQNEPERIVSEDDDTFLAEVANIQIEEVVCSDIKGHDNTGSSVAADTSEEILDSDDDLEPYDMSNDIPGDNKSRPHYIRDCLQGLIEAEKPEWTEKCLLSVPDLIHSNPTEASEVALEMAKVLLHLDDTFGMSDFVSHRHRALIAITVQCPFEVASYLTSQFYERDYNIRQRLDILEVVAAASQALSQPKYKVAEPEQHSRSSGCLKDTEETWHQIIEKRLEAKTRRISLGPRRKPPEPQLNMFGSVAGCFFFPLLEKFDSGNKMLNLMGDDSYVLGRLLYTLGVVMYSASNTPICRKMGSSLLKFLAATRSHAEAFVRKGAIFATTMVFISVPPFLLFSELQDDIVSSQMWLNDIVEKDYDVECQIKATTAAQLLIKMIEEEVPSINS